MLCNTERKGYRCHESGSFSSLFIGTCCVTNANGLISKRKYRKALKMASQIPSEGKEKLDKLKFLSNKPSNLSGKANQKGGGGRTLADVAEISVDDFLNLSDADIARIERALRAGK